MGLNLKGKVALVTGGSRGIGRAVCLILAREGAKVALNYNKNRVAAQGVASLIRTTGGQIICVQADVSSPQEVKNMVEKVLKTLGKIDILINNAGIWMKSPVLRTTEEQWDKIMAVNLKGVFNCCKIVGEHMIAKKNGKIINIVSFVGKRGSSHHSVYAASKGGVLAFTRSLAREWARYGITVNAVNPGRIKTDMTEPFYAKEKNRWLGDTPLRRLGNPEEVAEAVGFLASDKASYITGETIEINGGLLMD